MTQEISEAGAEPRSTFTVTHQLWVPGQDWPASTYVSSPLTDVEAMTLIGERAASHAAAVAALAGGDATSDPTAGEAAGQESPSTGGGSAAADTIQVPGDVL